MNSAPQTQKSRDGVLSGLDVLIQVLSLAKDGCAIPPAQIAFGSVGALLTMIRVRSPPYCNNKFPTYVRIGYHGQQAGIRRSWNSLRRCL